MRKPTGMTWWIGLALAGLLLPACLDDGSGLAATDGDLDSETAEEDGAAGEEEADREEPGESEERTDEESESSFLPAEEPGPYRAAAFVATFVDESRQRTLNGTVWYPTEATEGEIIRYQKVLALGHALLDAPMAPGGPFPLVVFSHGHQAFDAQSFFLTEHLASHGYVVAACDHFEDTTATFKTGLLVKAALDRPRDISTVIDTMLEWNDAPGHLLAGKIDPARIGMSGHSFGGNTAVAVLGAPFDMHRAREMCEEMGESNWTGEWWICDEIMASDFSYSDACDDPCAFGDDRILASIPMSPGLPFAFQEAGIGALRIPMLIMGGDLDDTVPFDTQIRKYYDWSENPEVMLWKLAGAGHMTFSNMCQLFSDPSLGCGPGFLDPERGWLLINTAATAYFGLMLKQDERYRAYFESPYLSTVPEVSIERKGE